MRFPDLGKRLFDKGKRPYLDFLTAYLKAEAKAGHLKVSNVPRASRQFLALIAGQVFRPQFVVLGCGGADDEAVDVEQAVSMMLAR
jgi:TetR/AcrR family transcriptional regulator, regulator of autoinduction and epiphytic fitness